MKQNNILFLRKDNLYKGYRKYVAQLIYVGNFYHQLRIHVVVSGMTTCTCSVLMLKKIYFHKKRRNVFSL